MGTKNLLNKFKKSSVTFDEAENENEQNKIQESTSPVSALAGTSRGGANVDW